MPKIIELCDEFDAAEKALRAAKVTSTFDLVDAEALARANLARFVKGLLEGVRNNDPFRKTQYDLNALSYFAAWAIMRGGFKP